MRCSCRFSNNTNEYIAQYQYILNKMMEEMCSAEMTESLSGSFITQMIPHHCAAIAMSENVLRYTTNIPLQNIALNIISSQQKSIENMEAVYCGCQTCINTCQDIGRYTQRNDCIIHTMFHEMESAYINNSIDADFMCEMIPHHRGAVCMAENALRFPLCQQLVPLLDQIIVSQKEGICQMQQLLQRIPRA